MVNIVDDASPHKISIRASNWGDLRYVTANYFVVEHLVHLKRVNDIITNM